MSSSGLLTRKQSWRKQSKNVNRKEHDFLYQEGASDDSLGEHPTRSTSEPSVNGLSNISQLGRIWATTGNLMGNGVKKPASVKGKRRVSFQPLVRVVLIPSRDEYAHAKLLPILWWEDSDYSFFKSSAVCELKTLMLSRRFKSSQEAIRILYQPGFDVEDAERETKVPCLDLSNVSKSNLPYEIFGRSKAEEKEPTMGLIEARTDVDLTDLKRHGSTECNIDESKIVHVHPLALMCQ